MVSFILHDLPSFVLQRATEELRKASRGRVTCSALPRSFAPDTVGPSSDRNNVGSPSEQPPAPSSSSAPVLPPPLCQNGHRESLVAVSSIKGPRSFIGDLTKKFKVTVDIRNGSPQPMRLASPAAFRQLAKLEIRSASCHRFKVTAQRQKVKFPFLVPPQRSTKMVFLVQPLACKKGLAEREQTKSKRRIPLLYSTHLYCEMFS